MKGGRRSSCRIIAVVIVIIRRRDEVHRASDSAGPAALLVQHSDSRERTVAVPRPELDDDDDLHMRGEVRAA